MGRRRARPAGAPEPFPWHGGWPAERSLSPDFFRRPVVEVARRLLGARLVSTVGGRRSSGVIVETEAYLGPDDPASHAATRRGRTVRNAAMFGPCRRAYVYRIYGMHWCLNVVTGAEGDPQAVLLRGLDPLEGTDLMAVRRGGRRPLASGPGRLCEALGVTGELYGHDFVSPPLELLSGWCLPDTMVGVSGRVGVAAASDWPLRFYVTDNPGVSRSPAVAARPPSGSSPRPLSVPGR